eukprot:6455301-Amphidinium_carterae.2
MKVTSALDKVYNEASHGADQTDGSQTECSHVRCKVGLLKVIRHENCTRLYAIFDDNETDGKMYIAISSAGKHLVLLLPSVAHHKFAWISDDLIM